MAGQKKRKPCKSQSSEKLNAVEPQPTNPHTGKLLEALSERRRSLRKKLKLGEEPSTEHGEINPVQDLLKEVPPWKKKSLHKYATPMQEVMNSSSHVPSRSFSGTIPRDDSPIIETNAAPQKSLGKRNAVTGYPPTNKTRSHRCSFDVNIIPEASFPPKHNLGLHASTKAPRIVEREVSSEVNSSSKKRSSTATTSRKSPDQARVNLIRERHDSPADLTWESLLLQTLKERCRESDEPRAEDNLMLQLRSLREQYPEDNEPVAEDNLSLLLQSLREQYPEHDEPIEHCPKDDEPIEQCPEPIEQCPVDDGQIEQCLEHDEQSLEDDEPIDDSEEGEKEPQVTTPVSIEESQGLIGKRGPTKLKGVAEESDGLIEVKFNTKGQPIGPGSVSLSSFLGPLVREIVPVTIVDWRKLTETMKGILWKAVQARYKVEEDWQKAYVFKEMGNLWRSSKSRLVNKIREVPNEEERLKLRPKNIKSEADWKAFVREKTSAEFKAKSDRFREMRKKLVPHTCSRKGYARLVDEMSKASTSKAPPSRDAVWAKAHIKKNGELITAAAGETVGNTEEQQETTPLSSITNVKKSVLSKVLGPDTIDRSRAFVSSEQDDRIARLEDECKELKEKMTYMQSLLEALLKNQDMSFLNQEQLNALLPSRNKCKIMDWTGSGEIVAEGRRSSTDPKALVHNIPLGPNAMRVWVDVVKKPDAFLWRPTSEMTSIEEAVGCTIAWPADKVIMTTQRKIWNC
ncbi:uncharacterized protein LOC21400762 isoform X1 [Morus notabilis]|uniref:uncharacterized protein LOC21400762 isoform X1 n=1 Tax=Morus notabilis TaxID=981085 RepID=UPI000CED0FBC|nr:uncharacterized protein LOC21400762 isoform X1 [Morus notabilis]